MNILRCSFSHIDLLNCSVFLHISSLQFLCLTNLKNITACKKSVISITAILANYFIFFKTWNEWKHLILNIIVLKLQSEFDWKNFFGLFMNLSCILTIFTSLTKFSLLPKFVFLCSVKHSNAEGRGFPYLLILRYQYILSIQWKLITIIMLITCTNKSNDDIDSKLAVRKHWLYMQKAIIGDFRVK